LRRRSALPDKGSFSSTGHQMNVHMKVARAPHASDQQQALTTARRRLAMTRAAARDLHPAIPRVLCPSCGEVMRLSRIDPMPSGHAAGETTTFECTCGDDYRRTIRERI